MSKMSKEVAEVIQVFRNMFPGKSESWIKRCIARLPTIRKISKNVWFIRCSPKLGDRRPYYIVTYDEKKGKYTCTCYDPLSPWGERRRKEICTHVGAVILSRLLGQKLLKVIISEHNARIWKKKHHKKTIK